MSSSTNGSVSRTMEPASALGVITPRIDELIERSADGMILVELGGRLLYANRAAADLFGRDRLQLLEMEFGEPLFAGETTELQIIRPDGRPRWVEMRAVAAEHPNPDGGRATLATLRDVTERREAAQRLAESEQRYRLLAENTTDLISRHGSGGRFEYAASAASRLFGYDPAMLEGKPLAELAAEADRARVAGLFRPSAEEATRIATYQFRHARGHYVWVETTCRHIPGTGNDGQALYVAVTRDVTRQRDLESQIQRAQKMEAVGRLAGGIAHDFNNLLTVITGYCELISKRDGRQCDELSEIRRASESAFGMTRQLLSFARKHQLAPQAIDLNERVSVLMPMFRSLVGETISVRFDPCSEQDARVFVDPNLFEQVVINLVVNARDAMPHGGSLVLSTECREKWVTLRVRDSGIGIAPELRDRIFEPFFTTKGPDRGTGLGLSTAFGIVRQSGGDLDFQTEPGHGTTFRLRLPHDKQEDRPAEQASSRPTTHATVLLVEDKLMLRKLLDRVLREAGFDVIMAEDGPAALELAEMHDYRFDVLVTDVVMPEMRGPELARRLYQRVPGLPTLFMSGYTDGELQDDAADLPDNAAPHFIQKPFSPDRLVERVNDLIRPSRFATN